jgi:hypothetical protein
MEKREVATYIMKTNMKPRRVVGFIIVGICILALYTAGNARGVEPSHGRQVLLNRGLQVQAQVFFDSTGFSAINRWAASNFTTINFQWSTNPQLLAQMPTGTAWGRWSSLGYSPFLTESELPYAGSFVSLQYGDEDNQTQSVQDTEKMFYAIWNTSNTLAFTNSGVDAGYGPTTLADLKQYMQYTRPDMLCFDYYPSAPWEDGNYSFSTRSRNKWYSIMQMYRTAGLTGYDNSGTSPIPYAQYLDLWRSSYSSATPSESFVRLQQNASWAFGYTFVSAFLYNDPSSSGTVPVMFSQAGDSSPTPTFSAVAETNRQSRNLGPALSRLVSTDIRMIPGTGKSASSTGISQWVSGHLHGDVNGNNGGNDYITGVTPITGLGGGASSTYNDVLIGYFKPLLANNPNCTFADGLHFMIVNGASQGTAAASAQWYRLTFNLTGSAFNELVRLSRDTGLVEAVPLTYSGGLYYLDFNLPGGTGDLFGFWNSGNPLPTVPEPSCIVLLSTALVVVLWCVWRRRM